MLTTKDLYDILENKIANEAQKSLIRKKFQLRLQIECVMQLTVMKKQSISGAF